LNKPVPPKPPPVNLLRDRIRAVRKIDLCEADIDFLKGRLELLTVGYVVSSPVLMPGQIIFRGRVVKTKPDDVRELSYPPKEFVKSLGRVNRAGESVFYGSVDRSATVFEVQAKPGDHLVVGRWTVTKRLMVNNVGFTKHVFDAYGSTRQLDPFWTNRDRPVPADAAALVATPSAKLVHDFFAHEFARGVRGDNTHEYKLSIAISEMLIGHTLTFDGNEELAHHPPRFAGIIYPSLAMLANADNIALKPEFADSFLKFESAEFMSIDGFVEPSTYTVTILDYANSTGKDGSIEWKGRLPKWDVPPGGAMRFVVENGVWVARDMLGNIVAPN
jgi:hypothetical protein